MKTTMIHTTSIRTLICTLILLLGLSINAWGTTLHYGEGGSSTMTYTAPAALPSYDDIGGWESYDIWCKSEIVLSEDYPSYGSYYGKGSTNYSGESDLYALYYNATTGEYSTQPTACTKLTAPSGLSVNTRFENSDKIYVKFSWTPGDATNASYQKFCFGKDGESGSCKSDVGKAATYVGDLRSKFTAGKWWWTVQTLGDGETYCNSNVVEGGEFCIDDVETSTPSGIEASLVTNTTATISWTAMDNAEGYIITIKKKSDGTVVTGFNAKDVTSTSVNVTGLSDGITYKVELYAYNECLDVSLTNSTYEFTTLTEYTVLLDGNGGEDGIAGVFNNATELHEITAPTRDHYTLEGYYTTDACATKIADDEGNLVASITVSSDAWTDEDAKWVLDDGATFYAKWTPDNHTISFDKNGGTGSMDAVVQAYNTTYKLPACGFTAPAGKVFDHWGEGSAGGTSRAVGYTHTVTADITFYAVWRDATYTNYTFACAELELDAPANRADSNVVRDTVYLTSTAEQKVRSLAKFHVSGTGLTASKEVKFTTGSDDLDAVYSFKKADGTAVTTNASGSVNEDVYIFYQPDADATSDGRDIITAAGGIRAYVERNADGGKPRSTKNTARTISGRHLPSQFIIAAKAGDYWYALPADMLKVGAQGGYSFTPDNSTTPTQATIAPEAAIYNLYGFATSSPYDSSFVRFAGDNDHKALWSNKSNSSVGIKNNAGIAGGSAKGEQYEWRLTNTGPNTYNLWNHAANLTGRYLGLKTSDRKWSMYADASGIVKELRILPIENISAYIGLLGDDWEESAFTYTKLSGEIPSHHHVQITYNGDTYTATESGTKITITDDDFSDAGGFTAAPGTQLTVEWCNSSNAVLAQGALFSPIIVSSNTENLSDYDADALAKTDIFITNKSKLTISENTTVHDVTVTSGATLFIDKADESTGATLTLSSGKLALRGGWNSAGTEYDMPRVYINPLSSLAKTNTTINFDISVDKRNYYPFAVPFRVKVSDVDYVNSTLADASTYGTHYVIKTYDGAGRAENGVVDDNWTVVPLKDKNNDDVYLEPGRGYIMTAVSIPAYGGGVIRFPMKNVSNTWTTLGEQGTVSETSKNVIRVTSHTGEATSGGGANNRHKGWNMLGVPFMSCYTSGTDMYTGEGTADLMTGRMTLSGDPADPYAWESGSVVYVSVPTHDFSEYIQTDITSAKLLPGWSFFIQVGTTGNLSFLTTQQREDSDMPIYAPQRTTDSTLTKIRTGVILSSESGEASDKFGLIISDRYTSDYEVGADLEKLFGNGYTLATYSLSLGTRLAFNALSTADAAQVIPVGYRAPADGQYTFVLNPRYPTDGLLRLELIDYQTGDLTDLLTSSYTFTTARTQDDTRFAIHAVYTDPAPATPTGAAPPLLNPDEPLTRKFILNGQLYIQRGQTIYDASGKEVRL